MGRYGAFLEGVAFQGRCGYRKLLLNNVPQNDTEIMFKPNMWKSVDRKSVKKCDYKHVFGN